MRRYYGQSLATGGGSTQPIDEILHTIFFPSKTDGFFIEAGANDGVFLSTCKVFEDMGWKGVNIEPSKSLFVQLCRNRPYSINLNIALSDAAGEVIFEETEFDNGGFSRIQDKERHKRIDTVFNISITKTYPIPTKSYAQLVQEMGITHVDLFVLDVEGFEPEVLRGMLPSLVLPNILCVEWTHCGLNDIKELLDNRYYMQFYDTLNAIFVKK